MIVGPSPTAAGTARDRPPAGRCWRKGLVGRLLSDRKGATIIMFAVTLPILIGFVGLSVEVSYWYLEKRKLQEAADSAALAGAYERRNDASASLAAMTAAAAAAMDKSGFPTSTQVVYNPPQSGPFAPGGALEDPAAVEVILTESYNALFVSLFGLNTVDIDARAVAVAGGLSATACILALEQCLNNDPGIQFQGSLDLQLVSCAVHSNDSCVEGINFNGNPTVVADCLTVGGTITGSSSNLTLLCLDGPFAFEPDVDDPYADVDLAAMMADINAMPCEDQNGIVAFADPSDGSWWPLGLISSAYAHHNPGHSGGGGGGGGGGTTFKPGRYCGNMNIANNTTLLAGVYFVEGNFFENGGTITGNPVILVYMNSTSTFDFRGNGDLAITAPTADQISNNNQPFVDSDGDGIGDDNNGDGIADSAFYPIGGQADDWAGLLIYNTSTVGVGNVNNCSNKINGTSDISAVGAFYFPNTCVDFTGNNKTSSNGACLQVIAGNISLSGNTGLDSTGCDPSFNFATYATMVGLVE